MGKRTSRKVRKPKGPQLAPEPSETPELEVLPEPSQEELNDAEPLPETDDPDGGAEPPVPVAENSGLGLTTLSDYYHEEPAELVPEAPVLPLTSAQLSHIREEAYEERFGRPVHEYRDGVMARLEDKLRSL